MYKIDGIQVAECVRISYDRRWPTIFFCILNCTLNDFDFRHEHGDCLPVQWNCTSILTSVNETVIYCIQYEHFISALIKYILEHWRKREKNNQFVTIQARHLLNLVPIQSQFTVLTILKNQFTILYMRN